MSSEERLVKRLAEELADEGQTQTPQTPTPKRPKRKPRA